MIGNETQEEIHHIIKLTFNSQVMGNLVKSSFKFVIMEDIITKIQIFFFTVESCEVNIMILLITSYLIPEKEKDMMNFSSLKILA